MYGSKHITVATVLTNLGSTWRSLGDSLKSKELFERALDIEQQTLEPMHPMVGTGKRGHYSGSKDPTHLSLTL